MALGYSIATILKRSSHVFSDDKVIVKIDWLEQLNRSYVQVQGRDRLFVKYIGEQLGLEGSYVPRTYIEQIQLEKLVNDVMALPDDLKTKLSIDEEMVSSPREALSRASADRVAMRNKNLKSGMSHSYSTQGDKNLSKLTRLAVNNRRIETRNTDPPAINPGVITHLSEQITTLTERMDEFTSRLEELNSKLNSWKRSQQNLSIQGETCNGCAPTSMFVSNLSNRTLLPTSSSSSSLLNKDSQLLEELSTIGQAQRHLTHQITNLTNLVHQNLADLCMQGRTDARGAFELNSVATPLVLMLAVGGIGIFLFHGLNRK